jgi:DNA topoisomerase-1
MIIYRFGTKDKWVYKNAKEEVVKDKKILDYIAALPPIPPAYRDVEIFCESAPKILYQGYDAKGRLQQIYSKKWREQADNLKFKALIDFGRKLPKMQAEMIKHIKDPAHTKIKVICLILRIISLCGFRIGQLKYQQLYNSTGLSTLKKKHLKFKSGKLEIKFVGKKGMDNECVMVDELVIRELEKLAKTRSPNDFLFTYDAVAGGKHENRLITANEVNDWLKSYNHEFTTKFFRTFDVNDRLIDILKPTEPNSLTVAQRKKNIVSALKDVSCAINNTPTICKKSYVNNKLIELYIDHPRKYTKLLIDNSYTSRVNFIRFLEDIY